MRLEIAWARQLPGLKCPPVASYTAAPAHGGGAAAFAAELHLQIEVEKRHQARRARQQRRWPAGPCTGWTRRSGRPRSPRRGARTASASAGAGLAETPPGPNAATSTGQDLSAIEQFGGDRGRRRRWQAEGEVITLSRSWRRRLSAGTGSWPGRRS